VYGHQFDLDIDDDYDVDTPASVILAHQAMRREAMMPGSTWSKLSESDRAIWDQLSDDTKTMILSARSQSKPKGGGPRPRPPPKRLVNLADVLQACQHLAMDPGENTPDTMAETPEPDAQSDEPPTEDSPGPDLLAFATNRA
jgi:hypothetical protein